MNSNKLGGGGSSSSFSTDPRSLNSEKKDVTSATRPETSATPSDVASISWDALEPKMAMAKIKSDETEAKSNQVALRSMLEKPLPEAFDRGFFRLASPRRSRIAAPAQTIRKTQSDEVIGMSAKARVLPPNGKNTSTKRSLFGDDNVAHTTPRDLPKGVKKSKPVLAHGLEPETKWSPKNTTVAAASWQSHYVGNKTRSQSLDLGVPPNKPAQREAEVRQKGDSIFWHEDVTVQIADRGKGGRPGADLTRGKFFDYKIPSGVGLRVAENKSDDPDRRTIVGFLNKGEILEKQKK